MTSAPFPNTAPTAVYSASKAESEKALWEFVEREKPGFRVNAVLPDANFGAVLSTEGNLSSGGWIRGVFAGNLEFVKWLPPGMYFSPRERDGIELMVIAWYINVADTARLHVAALLDTKVENERLFGFAGRHTWNGILAILRGLYPGKTFPEDLPTSEVTNVNVPNERAEGLLKEVFGKGWVSLEDTVKENVAGLE